MTQTIFGGEFWEREDYMLPGCGIPPHSVSSSMWQVETQTY